MLTAFFVENPTTSSRLQNYIARAPGFRVLGRTDDGPRGVELTRRLGPDLVVLDKDVLGLDWINATRPQLATAASTRLVLVPLSDQDCLLLRSRQNGVMGYLFKYSAYSELTSAIRSIHAGQSHLGAAKALPPKNSKPRRKPRRTRPTARVSAPSN